MMRLVFSFRKELRKLFPRICGRRLDGIQKVGIMDRRKE